MITIYTDGSCLTNPGNGGWAAIINDEKVIRKISGNEKNTTNNRMELLAPINALKDMKPGVEIKIYTDSQYVKNGITEWINSWLANNWKTSKKADKLLKLTVDTGIDVRTVVSGIAEHYKAEEIVGQKVSILLNLAPRKIRGVESQGMILMAENEEGELAFVSPTKDIGSGNTIR